MSNSVLYASNNVSQAVVASGSVLNFGSIVRKYGNNIVLSGGNAVITAPGYYDVDTNLTFVSGGNGDVTVQIYKDGVAIPGANITFGVANGVTYAFNVPTVVRQKCCCESPITVVVGGVAGSVSVASIIVEKL